MAFEDIKVRGLTFAERGELIKSGLDPLYTPVPEEAPDTERLLRSRELAQWIMQHIYGLTEDEINAAPDNDLMEVALDTMRFTHEKKAEIDKPKYCSDCIKMQRETKQHFDCTECEFNSPHQLDGTRQAMRVYNASRMQRRWHSGGIAGFDMPAALEVARAYGIEPLPHLIDLLVILEAKELEVAHKNGQ